MAHRSFASSFALAAALVVAPGTAQQCGDYIYTVGYDTSLRTVDPLTGATLSSTGILDTQFAHQYFNGMAIHPATQQIYVVPWYAAPNNTGRYLATLDPVTATTAPVGMLGIPNGNGTWMADITFEPGGTLFGIIGDGGTDPQTLYIIDTATAALTQVMSFPTGPGTNGEAIAFHAQTGLLYRMSGSNTAPGGTATFEAIDVTTQTVTNIPLTGYVYEEAMELVNLGDDNFLWTDINQDYGIVTASGEVRLLGNMDHWALGMGFVREPANVPFFRQYGFGCPASAAGRHPWLVGTGCASPGQAFTVTSLNGEPNRFGLMAIGQGNTAAPVAPLQCPVQIFPVATSVGFVADPNGDWSVQVPVPGTFGVPFDIYFQSAQIDANFLFTISNPLQVHFQ